MTISYINHMMQDHNASVDVIKCKLAVYSQYIEYSQFFNGTALDLSAIDRVRSTSN